MLHLGKVTPWNFPKGVAYRLMWTYGDTVDWQNLLLPHFHFMTTTKWLGFTSSRISFKLSQVQRIQSLNREPKWLKNQGIEVRSWLRIYLKGIPRLVQTTWDQKMVYNNVQTTVEWCSSEKLKGINLSNEYWEEAVACDIYVINRSLTKSVMNKVLEQAS